MIICSGRTDKEMAEINSVLCPILHSMQMSGLGFIVRDAPGGALQVHSLSSYVG